MKIAIIPARGGSKRIPRKNIKDFLGKPIIAYSIETALSSGLFDEVFVSTDDNEIAEIAKKYGAMVPELRSKKNSDDFATTVDVLNEVIDWYTQNNIELDLICCIYPTAPLISSADLIEAYALFKNENFNSLLSGVPFNFPVQRGFTVDHQNKVNLLNSDLINNRSQDLPLVYHDAGAFYFFKRNTLEKYNGIWTDNTGIFILDPMKEQDIDTFTDWQLAELKYNYLNSKSN